MRTHSLSFSTIAHAASMPDKFAELELEPERRGAHRGQVLILFAGFRGLMGMLGLATDVGYTLAARRTAQGAADAGRWQAPGQWRAIRRRLRHRPKPT